MKFSIPLIGLAIILLHWFTDTVKPDNMLYIVKPIYFVPVFETRYLYAYAHLFTLIPIFCLSFDKKVAYYTKWKYVLPAIFIVAVPFWIWDIAKTDRGVWGFNPAYYTNLFLNLPIEEWLFFITFPWASVFIYECLNNYFPLKIQTFIGYQSVDSKNVSKIEFMKVRKIDKILTPILILFLFVTAFFYWGHLYTFTTFFAAGTVLLWQDLYGYSIVRQKFYRMFPISTMAFILINSVFTGAFTKNPIVVYNPEEYTGIRFFTIPFDDFAYNFLLTFSVIIIYEFLKNKKLTK